MVSSLINIPPNFGAFFAGLGGLILFLVISYGLYLVIKHLNFWMEVDSKRLLLSDILLEKAAQKRGIDLVKEMKKREIFETKNFQKKLELEIMEDFFGKDGED